MTVLPFLKAFLQQACYDVMIDDADKDVRRSPIQPTQAMHKNERIQTLVRLFMYRMLKHLNVRENSPKQRQPTAAGRASTENIEYQT